MKYIEMSSCRECKIDQQLVNAANKALIQLRNAISIYGGEYSIDADQLNEAYQELKIALKTKAKKHGNEVGD